MHKISSRFFPVASLLASLLITGFASAQTPKPAAKPAAPVASAALTGGEYQITGFRSARFGMTIDEVKQAIQKDFKPAEGAVAEIENPAERTKIVVVQLPLLDPGPGPASVSYILGATSRRLVHVNVAWTTGQQPTESMRNEITAAGVLLADYFRNLKWKPNGSTTGIPEGQNGLALFIGVDTKNAAVELHISGVTVTGPNGAGPAPTGPAQLRVSYIADLANPDVATIKPGSF